MMDKGSLRTGKHAPRQIIPDNGRSKNMGINRGGPRFYVPCPRCTRRASRPVHRAGSQNHGNDRDGRLPAAADVLFGPDESPGHGNEEIDAQAME
ncbi:hypothetical protein [Paraburkholderia caballeronis]|uniref:hypothetical protein n=1 Tax=Paraburkholderia caballeronis TaxID=416943 RepID=UPI0011B9466F|nr:hypothetical protein [Paraburkholderia caballeronis]